MTTTTATTSVPTTSPPALMVTSPPSAVALAGSPFNFTVTTTCTSTPVIRAVGLLAGFVLADHKNCTATISGTARNGEAGVHTAQITAKADTTVTQQFVITVDSPPVLRVRGSLTVSTGVPFTYLVTTDNGQPQPSITTTSRLPGGVSLTDNANGAATLAGTPGVGTGGLYPLSLTASNGVGAPATATIVLAVREAPAFTGNLAVTVTAGVPMAPFTVVTTGYPAPSIRAVGLPSGLSMVDGGNGTATVSGTPTAIGTHAVALRARNGLGPASGTLVVTVVP